MQNTQNERRRALGIVDDQVWIAGEHEKPDGLIREPRTHYPSLWMISDLLRCFYDRVTKSSCGSRIILCNPASRLKQITSCLRREYRRRHHRALEMISSISLATLSVE